MNIDSASSVYLNGTEIVRIVRNGSTIWEKVAPDYFYVENTYSGSNTVTLTTTQSGSPTSGTYATTVEYSKDKLTWTTLNLVSGQSNTISMNQGEKVYFRNDSGVFNFHDVRNGTVDYYTSITSTNTINVGGNTNSLFDYTNMSGVDVSNTVGGLSRLFSGSTNLINANNLVIPQTTYPDFFITEMFNHCESLITTPNLNNVVNIGFASCSQTFGYCYSLVTPPDFNSVISTGTRSGFSWCFHDCTSLTRTPYFNSLTTLGPYGLNQCFTNCTSLTDIMFDLSGITSVSDYGLNRTFMNTKITTGVDVRNVTSIGNQSFVYTYNSCSLLDTVYSPSVSSWNTSYFNNWLYGVGSFGVIYNYGSATLTKNSASGCPSGWIIQPTKTATITNGFHFEQSGNTYNLKFTINNYNSMSLHSGWSGEVTTGNHTYNFTSSNLSSNNVTISGISSSNIPNAGDTATMTISYSTYDLYSGSGNVYIKDSLSINGNVKFEEVSTDTFTMTIKVSNLDLTTLPSGWSGTVVSGSKSFNFNASKVSGTDTITLTNISRNNIPTTGDSAIVTINANTYTSYVGSSSVNVENLVDYFYIQNEYSGTNTFTLSKAGTPASSDLAYSKNKTNWTSFNLSQSTNTVTLNNGEKLYLRSSTGTLSIDSDNYYSINCSQNYSVGGNCNSILNYNNINNISLPDFCYYALFMDSTKIIDASNMTLPSMSIGDGSYHNMFRNCTSLVNPPQTLPATDLTNVDIPYDGMFYGCSSLTSMPNLMATSVGFFSYSFMFARCTSLTTLKDLPATTLGIGSYEGMFSECTNITKSPRLPARTLTQGCYEYMFRKCSKLKEVTISANNISAEDCLHEWLYQVAVTGTFHNLGSASYPSGTNGIPSGWTEVHS